MSKDLGVRDGKTGGIRGIGEQGGFFGGIIESSVIDNRC